MRIVKTILATLVLVAGTFTASQAQVITENVTIVELSQTTGAFDVTSLNLKPGKYQFKVTNTDVAKEVGFVIQSMYTLALSTLHHNTP